MSDAEDDELERRVLATAEHKSHEIKATTAGTMQCTVTLSFEVNSRRAAEKVIQKLARITVYNTESLVDHATDLLQEDLEKVRQAGEILKAQHKAELAAMMKEVREKTTALDHQGRELTRLKKLEQDLEGLAKIGKVLR